MPPKASSAKDYQEMVGIRHESGRLLDGVAQLGFLTVLAPMGSHASDALHRKHL